METLIDLLNALEENDNQIEFVDKEGKLLHLSYRDLVKACKKNAEILKNELGILPGERVIIHTANSFDFVKLFWSVVYSGAVAVPVTAPKNGLYDENSQETIRFQQICGIIVPKMILCGVAEKPEEVRRVANSVCTGIQKIESFATYEARNMNTKGLPNQEDVGIIVFTSGSTGLPKGVPLTHKNILAGIRAEQSFLQYQKGQTLLNWFPLEHVVPLIVYHIMPMYLGANQIQVAPSYILEDIRRWLSLVSDKRVNSTWAPDFAYVLLYNQRDAINQMELDLSCVCDILNGGEAINYSHDQKCMEWLEKKGLKKNAMVPIWGMSEASVGITLTRKFGMNTYNNAVSVGQVLDTYELRICNEGEIVLEDEIEGEIQVKGPAVFGGYLNEERNVFSEDGWFVTGDIGVWKNGEVIICGRKSEKIIVNGVNISTNDIGNHIRKCLQSGNYDPFVRAWARRNAKTQRDELFVFVGGKQEDVNSIILKAVAERFQHTCDYIVYVSVDNIKRTALGKVDKRKMFEAFDQGEYLYWNAKETRKKDVVESKEIEWSDEKRMMMELWAYVLGISVDSFTPEESFFVLGGDSAKVGGLIHKINELFKVSLTAMEFVKYDTVAKLVQYLESLNETEEVQEQSQDDEQEVYVF